VRRDVNREPEHTLPGAAPTDVAALRRYRVPQHLTTRHDTPTGTALRSDSQPPKCHTSIDTGEKTYPKAAANEKRERVPD